MDWWRKVQPSYKNAYLDEKFIRGETEFLKMAVEAGFIKPKGLKKGLWRVIKPWEMCGPFPRRIMAL